MNKLKDKKVWAPIVGVAALAAGWYNGVGIDAAAQVEATGQITDLVSNGEVLYASVAALLAMVAGWFSVKK